MRRILWVALGCLLLTLAIGCSEEEETTAPDALPPAAIDDLVVAAVTPTSVTLTWTASGDDSVSGRAAAYDLRYRSEPFTLSAWDSLSRAAGEPSPETAGAAESLMVTGLAPETDYYFGLVVIDDADNHSGLSNVALATTARITRSWTIARDGTGDFTTIADGIAAAGAGDTLRIAAGVYEEALLFGGHDLVLIGAGAALTRIVHTSDLPGGMLIFAGDSDLEFQQIGLGVLDEFEGTHGFTADDSRITLRNCALIECGLFVAASDLTLSRCTIYGNPPTTSGEPAPLVWLLGGAANIERSIIVYGNNYGVACQDVSVSFLCNDCYDHAEGNYSGCADPTGLNGNISDNPLFVDPAAGDFRLQPDSPCAGVSGCGPMGAFEVAE